MSAFYETEALGKHLLAAKFGTNVTQVPFVAGRIDVSLFLLTGGPLGHVGLLDHEETKKHVDLYNEMNDDSNDEHDEETVNQDMKLYVWEKNGPEGAMLTISCGVSFN